MLIRPRIAVPNFDRLLVNLESLRPNLFEISSNFLGAGETHVKTDVTHKTYALDE